MLFLEQTSILSWFGEQIASTIAQHLIGTILGIGVSYVTFYCYKKQKYSGWKVIVKEGDEIKVNRTVGYQRAEKILADRSDLAVFLKGVTSPYERQLNEDIVSEHAKTLGLFQESKKEKTWIIDISKNPPPKQKNK